TIEELRAKIAPTAANTAPQQNFPAPSGHLGTEPASNDGYDRVQLMKLDAECAKQALRTFNQAKADSPEYANSTYANHYSRKHKKCFVCIDWSGTLAGVAAWGTILEDAYEHKVYGRYQVRNRDNKKFWEVRPDDCWLAPDGELINGRACSSDAEFDD